MAGFTPTTRVPGIVGALLIASVLIGCAYLASNPNLFKPNTANAASTQALLQAYAQKDSDNDGLPDWEEALYGTDPHNPHSVSATLTDGEAVAQGLIKPKFTSETASSTVSAASLPGINATSGSITDQFSQELLGQYLLQSNGTEPSQDDITAYVQQQLQALVASHQNTQVYNPGNETVSGTGAAALTTYAGATEAVFAKYATTYPESELDYFTDAVEKNDTSGLSKIATIGAAYTSVAKDLIQVPVPSEAAQAHLEIANAAANLGTDITDMSTMQTDPLRAYLGLLQYETDVPALSKGFADLDTVFTGDSVSISQGTGSHIYSTAQMAAKQQ